MAYKIFDEVGLFKSFDIPITPFIQYFSALERGYIDLPCKSKFLEQMKQILILMKWNCFCALNYFFLIFPIKSFSF